jgi:hypothetical protein
MGPGEPIDVTFDVSSDTPPGMDPDAFSPTLRRYHQFLWSKPLPSGELFDLDVTTPGVYLHHHSELGEFELSSDAATHTYSRWPSMKGIIDQIPPAETEQFMYIGSTIGGYVVYPGNRIDGKITINQARGIHPRIKDRFDLTLECIRRHYDGEPNPLAEVLARYADFFGLFGDFVGYVGFFLLEDLVDEDALAVRFWLPFEDFVGPHVPDTLDAYIAYRQRVIGFVEARNRRIAAYVSAGR